MRHLSSRRRTCSLARQAPGANDDSPTALNSVFEAIVGMIGNADPWLVSGASGTRQEFLAWLSCTWLGLSQRVTLVRAGDDPVDGELLMLAMPSAARQEAA
jgi:hypothetical protein